MCSSKLGLFALARRPAKILGRQEAGDAGVFVVPLKSNIAKKTSTYKKQSALKPLLTVKKRQ